MNQRRANVPIDCREKLVFVLQQVSKQTIVRQICASVDGAHTYLSTFLNCPKNITEGGKNEGILAGRHCVSQINQSIEFWPVEPEISQLAWSEQIYKSSMDLTYGRAHFHLDEEALASERFSSVDKTSAFCGTFGDLIDNP